MTIFDKILAGEIPADRVYENDDVLAFRDINPQAPVHVLVIPKTRWSSLIGLADADPAAAGRFMAGVAATARELGLEESGYRTVFNTGDDAQQTVRYLHAHILGGRKMNWPPG
ncbi:histidine triad nucleotide-binding protein [Spirochaeta africana]|uniref:HIT family hydrolase, diadenosine tetraphosphate hydrolase n=1 Tax=Spirochaeta africana (strain ATCC 700263 / DSM 8902 / Z-7692) TaxID=889378 RepID=H9UMI2_SPIAZ|nr:histidine triad nucleotide-binding protein [Spirochaeta africana]AFG38725.1 HIT family hydrolase, diadenosine tetraphosphate hydrolase [Spirochaeta africana DSM 8902]